jgi:hypothetical protein
MAMAPVEQATMMGARNATAVKMHSRRVFTGTARRRTSISTLQRAATQPVPTRFGSGVSEFGNALLFVGPTTNVITLVGLNGGPTGAVRISCHADSAMEPTNAT